MALAIILLIVCLAVPIFFIVRNYLKESKNQNNLLNEQNDSYVKIIENSPQYRESLKQVETDITTTTNNIFTKIANDISIIKFWVQFFAILQIVAFLLGLIVICVKCS